MKFTKFAAFALISALIMAGCARERLPIYNNNGDDYSNKGLLSLANLSIDCRIDENDPSIGTMTRTTRGSVDTSAFDCWIINEDNEIVSTFKLGERPSEAIELETGDYIFKIQSGEVPGAAWDTPIYGTSKAFKIVRNETTALTEVVCTLMQIKVTITYAADLLERLGEKTITTATIGENSLEFALTEERAGFFVAPLASNTIELHIEGTYAADKVNHKIVEMNKQVQDVKVGQHSKIHFYIENASEGKINIGVTIRDWVTDEVIPCNVADLVTEEEITEGDEGGSTTPTEDPSIVWDGHDISVRENIVAGLKVDLIVTASKGIKEFLVQIDSDTLTPAELSNVGLCDVLNLCYPTQSYNASDPTTYIDVEQPLRDLEFKVGEDVINKTYVKLSITQFMSILSAVGQSGHMHDFIITVTDNEGNTTVKTLMLKTA